MIAHPLMCLSSFVTLYPSEVGDQLNQVGSRRDRPRWACPNGAMTDKLPWNL